MTDHVLDRLSAANPVAEIDTFDYELEQLLERIVAEPRPPRRWSRRLRLGAPLAIVASGLVAAGAVGVAQDKLRKDARPAPPSAVAIDTATATTRTPSVADPRGGPAWSTVEFRTRDGRWCAKPGRLIAGQIGNLGARGQITGSSLREGGDCVDVDALSTEQPIAWHVSEEYDNGTTTRNPVSYVWGLARPDVERVIIDTNAGPQTATVSAGHAFIAVFAGRISLDAVTMRAIDQDATSKTITLPAPGPNTRDLLRNPPTADELDAARHRAR